ncbi:calcyphosin-like protein [Diadema setosum]|uniref:calcyphosin-like protein n=1 Tax=Diadema setosum TaxID=31175 RepID=UPI003B3B037E
MDALQELKASLAKRGPGGIKSLGRQFRIMDDDGNKSLNLEEFCEGLTDFKVSLTPEKQKELFAYFDKDGSGSLNFDEFLLGVRPAMSESRMKYVDKAFAKMDKTGDGVVTVKDLKGVYNAREHPKYKNGEWDEKKVFEEYLKSFEEPNNADGKVTKEEFINYYSAVSANIDTDIYFITMMTNAWKL